MASDDGITEEDLRDGKYDFADVRMFLANDQDLAQGILKLRPGWLGEVTRHVRRRAARHDPIAPPTALVTAARGTRTSSLADWRKESVYIRHRPVATSCAEPQSVYGTKNRMIDRPADAGRPAASSVYGRSAGTGRT